VAPAPEDDRSDGEGRGEVAGPARGGAGLDPSHLAALHALLAERSVSGAAARLQRTQPTLSRALARLRRHYGDPLLVRHGNRNRLTDFAARLLPEVASAAAALDRVARSSAEFDPATSGRTFTVMSSDHGIATAGARLLAAVSRAAPGVTLRFTPVVPRLLARDDEVLRALDGVLLPHGLIEAGNVIDLHADRWVCVAGADNPAIGDALTLGDLSALAWISTSSEPFGRPTPWHHMRALGVTPRVVAVVETSFLAQAPLLIAAGAVALLQYRLAELLVARTELRILELPFDAPPIVEGFWWHPRHDGDPGHRWLRERAAEIAEHP
jgi:DNA-binding transcriptional LysR family regulator